MEENQTNENEMDIEDVERGENENVQTKKIELKKMRNK
jgi:hypothetical protein